MNNGYPNNIVNKFVDDRAFYYINKIDSNYSKNNETNSNKQNFNFYLKLPYVHTFYRNISRKMSGFGIKVVPKIKYALNGIIKDCRAMTES